MYTEFERYNRFWRSSLLLYDDGDNHLQEIAYFSKLYKQYLTRLTRVLLSYIVFTIKHSFQQ